MPTHKEVYEQHAQEYEALVSREDHEGNILKVLERIIDPRGLDILDLGAGTGRLAVLLAPFAHNLLALDLSAQMLAVARDKLTAVGPRGRSLAAAADHRALPLLDSCVDLVVSGWSVSYVATWYRRSWRGELESWLAESRRVLRAGGIIVLFESLGTGNETPVRLPHLEDFFGWLDEAGFENTWIRTDYRFENKNLAEDLSAFFFGEEMKERIKRSTTITLPECTGVWWIHSGRMSAV